MRLSRSTRTGVLLGSALAAGALAPMRVMAQDGTWALTNARIETVTHGVIEHGTIVIRDGLIAAVGPSVTVPADARVFDVNGLTVYPGLIDLTSTMGLATPAAGGAGAGERAAPAAGGNEAPRFVGLEPQREVADELRLVASEVKNARDAGLTAVLVAPARGAFRGLSALIPLQDSAGRADVIRTPVALQMGFQGAGTGGFGGQYPATLLGVIAYERQSFYDAQRRATMLDRYRSSPRGMKRPEYDPQLDALVPVVRRDLPVFFDANNENEIRRAERIAKEFGLKLVVSGATEGFRALDALRGQTAIVSVNFPKSTDVTGWTYRSTRLHPLDDSAAADKTVHATLERNAATLDKAGVHIALASGGLRAGEFLANVRKTVAAGLPADVALAALTIRPAELAGASDVLGSIENGKIANLVITKGALLSDSAKVRFVFVDGARYEVIEPPAASRGSRNAAGAGGAAGAMGGTWNVSVVTPQGANTSTMTITQTGSSFTGQMVSEIGTLQITDGAIDGKHVTWSTTANLGGRSVQITFEGDVDGTRMSGNASLGQLGTATFTAEKTP
jgi:imidazolonepropionase-like amidohydrolase